MINVFKKFSKLLFLCVMLIGCQSNNKKEIKTEKVSFTKEGELRIYKGDSLLVEKIDIEIADNEYERQTGLMYRSSMKEDFGMLFIFEEEKQRYFYMKNTEIPLDIIYINSDKKVVSLIKNAAPMNEASLPSNVPAKYVLELNSGMIDTWNIEKGDRIEYKKVKSD